MSMTEQDVEQVGTADIESLSFEQAQAELERIVELLEDQHTGLDQALQLWERGEALHAYCQKRLDHAAERIERLQVSPDEAAAVVAESGDDFAHAALESAPAAPETAPGSNGAPGASPVTPAAAPANGAAPDSSDEPTPGQPKIF